MLHCGKFGCLTLILVCLVLGEAGCSKDFDYGDTGRINGRLTMDGKPLPEGHGVIFMEPIKGYLAYGETDADGHFEVNSWNNGDMPVGTYKVQIGGPPAPEARKDLTAEELFDHPELIDPVAPPIQFPKKYVDKSTSGLEFVVKAGPNTYDIDLKKE